MLAENERFGIKYERIYNIWILESSCFSMLEKIYENFTYNS
jgi:hypothetical protein